MAVPEDAVGELQRAFQREKEPFWVVGEVIEVEIIEVVS